MSADDNTLPRISAETAAAVVDRFGVDLEEEAVALLGPDTSPKVYLRALLEAGLNLDATRFLAFALEPREAVWWACLCARQTLGETPDAADLQALEAAEGWVRAQDEEFRRVTETVAESSGGETAAGVAVLAAFMSEGSIAPPDVDAVPAPEGIANQLVAAAVLMAGAVGPPEQGDERYRTFLAKGIEIAMGAPIGTQAT